MALSDTNELEPTSKTSLVEEWLQVRCCPLVAFL